MCWKGRYKLPVMISLVAFLITGPGCGKLAHMNPGDQQHDITGSLEYGGANRTYRLHLPSSYDGTKAAPLVFAFHGGGGDAEGMEKLTHLSRIADEHGFIVVYPDGLNNQWNDGRPEINPGVDDVGFISALIDQLEKDYEIDQDMIYSTGISNGGFFSFRLACELSEKIAAVAPVAALMGENLSKTCSPQSPIPVMIIIGTDDPLVPWNGGEIMARGSSRGRILSESSTVSFWAKVDGCSQAPVITYEPDMDPSDGTRVRRETYAGGSDKAEVVLLAVEGGGHTWPGGIQYASERTIGKTSDDIDAGEVIWDFFQKHPK